MRIRRLVGDGELVMRIRGLVGDGGLVVRMAKSLDRAMPPSSPWLPLVAGPPWPRAEDLGLTRAHPSLDPRQ